MSYRPFLVAGARGAQFGLWVAKRGVNALTATGDNLLIDSNDTMPMPAYLSKDVVSFSGTSNQTIQYLYGYTLPNPPFIWYQVVRSGITYIPSMQFDTPMKDVAGAPPRFRIAVAGAFMNVTNLKPVIYNLQFMVMMYPID